MISLTVIFILTQGCLSINSKQLDYVGHWEWQSEKDGYSDSGYLELRRDGKYRYQIKLKNQTELITQESQTLVHDWYISDGSVCLEGIKKDGDLCIWEIAEDGSGEDHLIYKSEFLREDIPLTRSGD